MRNKMQRTIRSLIVLPPQQLRDAVRWLLASPLAQLIFSRIREALREALRVGTIEALRDVLRSLVNDPKQGR